MKDKSQLKTRNCSISLSQGDYDNMKIILSVKQRQFSSVVGDLIKQYITDNKSVIETWNKTFGK